MIERPSPRTLISGHAGPIALPLRALLRVLSWPYRWVVVVRNWRYDRAGPFVTLPIPVISIGNITTGGTGKTPLVIDVVRRLVDLGRRPAVVARGYKAADGEPGDEECLVRRHCGSVAYVADANRARGGWHAHKHLQADVVVLDDGFQHRRLARVLNIITIDATCPFGYGYLLPRGLLREPLGGLARADVVVVTRSDQVPSESLRNLVSRLESLSGRATVLRCCHRIVGVEDLDGVDIASSIAGQRAVLFAGIGHPAAFRTTAESLGVVIAGQRWWPDHHPYRHADIDELSGLIRSTGADRLLTTEKDAVKLARLEAARRLPIAVVRVAIDFVSDDGTMLQGVIEEALQRP